MGKKIKAVEVRFGEDNVSVLYLDGKYVFMNDDYHEGGHAFESFIAGVEWSGKEVSNIKTLYVDGPDDDEDNTFPSNDGSNIPDVWQDGKWSKKAKQ